MLDNITPVSSRHYPPIIISARPMTCFCGKESPFESCCNPLLAGARQAASPEELMRSRYSAFCEKNIDYLLDTTDPQIRASQDEASYREWANAATFTKLEVLSTDQNKNKGFVEFKAYYQLQDKECLHHEQARFRKQGDTWYYREGKVFEQKPADEVGNTEAA